MADVWKVTQNLNAETFYNHSNVLGSELEGITGRTAMRLYISDVEKANNMTKVCEEMSKTYDQIIDDQNDYQMEVDAQLAEIEKLQLELERKVNEREAEKEKLVQAAGDEGLSDEDKEKFGALNDEIKGLTNDTNSQITGLNDKAVTAANGAKSDLNKAEIATKYGEKALEKGEPLTNMKDKKKSFWRKTFGGWNKAPEREAGKKLVSAGTTLLEQVQTSSDIEKEINKKLPKKSV